MSATTPRPIASSGLRMAPLGVLPAISMVDRSPLAMSVPSLRSEAAATTVVVLGFLDAVAMPLTTLATKYVHMQAMTKAVRRMVISLRFIRIPWEVARRPVPLSHFVSQLLCQSESEPILRRIRDLDDKPRTK